MTLLLGITLGLQAQTTLYSWEGGADGATETGGKAESVNGTDNRLNYKNGDNYTMCLNGKKANINDATASANASKMVITLDSELAEGDEIAFTAYINKNESKKASPYILFENGTSAEGEIFSDAENIDPAFNGAPATKVTKVPAEAAGSKTITLSRSQSGTNLFITKLVITRAGGSEEAKPAITFEAGNAERSVTVGLNAAGTVYLDWGDGNKVQYNAEAAYDGWDNALEFFGQPVGTVKVYGEGITYFESFTKMVDGAVAGGITSIDLSGAAATLTELDIHQNNLASVDLSKLTKLEKLTIGVNDFTAIDLSANTELTMLDITNGKLTAIDLSKNTKLNKIVLSGNKLTTLDLTNNTLAKTITVLDNQLTSVTFGDNTATKHTFNFGGNKLTTIDLSKFADASGMYLRLRDNDLTGDAIKLPCAIKQLWVDYNAFTLAQLYALKALATQTFTYATADPDKEAQAPMQITAEGDKVDLSSQAKLGETATVFTWKKADGTALVEGTDYTVADGVFTFLNAAEDIYCEMTNAELNAFTAEKPYKTTAVSVTAGGSEEAKPAIAFEAGAVERTVAITLPAVGDKASIDWGDGNKIELAATDDGWGGVSDIEFTGTPAGTVKIYGENIKGFASFTKYATDATTITGGITSIDLTGVAATLTSLDVHQNNLASIDLSKLTNLTDLNIGVNDFTTVDVSANTELTKIDASNGKNNGALTAIDLSKNTKLTNIVLSGNKLTTLDLTNNTNAKTVTVLNNQLTSVKLGANANKNHTINLGGNKLTAVDLSQFTNLAGSYIYLRDNDLTGDAIKLPEGATVKRLWVDYNAFTLAQLYALKALATQTFTYATADPDKEAQAPMQITAEGDKVDLSSQAKLGETATVFTWKKADGTALVEGTDYTVADGVFTFLNAAEDIYCEMTNAELNAFTAEKPYKTTAVSVVATGINDLKAEGGKAAIFNMAGQRVAAPVKGLNIIDGKIVLKRN